MRAFSILGVLVLAAAVSAPLAQTALASQQEQQAMATQAATSKVDSAYTVPQPTMGD